MNPMGMSISEMNAIANEVELILNQCGLSALVGDATYNERGFRFSVQWCKLYDFALPEVREMCKAFNAAMDNRWPMFLCMGIDADTEKHVVMMNPVIGSTQKESATTQDEPAFWFNVADLYRTEIGK